MGDRCAMSEILNPKKRCPTLVDFQKWPPMTDLGRFKPHADSRIDADSFADWA